MVYAASSPAQICVLIYSGLSLKNAPEINYIIY